MNVFDTTFSEAERARFRALQNREDEGPLSPAEQEDLLHLTQRLEQAEVAMLAPALARLDAEAQQAEAQTQTLTALVERKTALALRLESLLNELQSERHAIDEEVARALDTGGSSPSTQSNGAVRDSVGSASAVVKAPA